MKSQQPAPKGRAPHQSRFAPKGAMQKMADQSPATQQLASLQKMADASQSIQRMEEEELQGKFIQRMEEEELMQGKAIQRVEVSKKNNTGLPDGLKSGIENLSGMSMDGVKVHRNSDKPAAVQAHAYAQGTNIHLGPGQEKHLPHEAWHVVQQAQGRVKPTTQLKGVAVNDDVGLEAEADVMGAKALQTAAKATQAESATPVQRHVIQMQQTKLFLKKASGTYTTAAGVVGQTFDFVGNKAQFDKTNSHPKGHVNYEAKIAAYLMGINFIPPGATNVIFTECDTFGQKV
jgi:hypothetical protein